MSLTIRDLKESNGFLNLLFQNITSALLLVDKQAQIQTFNDSFSALFKKGDAAILGQRCGNAMGCVFTVIEEKLCGTTSFCSECTFRRSLLEAFTNEVPVFRRMLTREFYINDEKVLKYFQYTAKHIPYNGVEMVLVIIDDITNLEEQKLHLERHNQFIRRVFGRYMSNSVVTSLLTEPAGLSMGGEKRRVTIMMADLRGFTAHAERLPPESVVSIINNFLEVMTDIIEKYEGTINEFIGDAIMALFGAPLGREDDAIRAVACAIDMQLAMRRVNEKNRLMGLPEVEMGIGINTGEVVVGNVGSERRASYGVVGSHVNLTSRIESYTIGGQILISSSTRKEVAPLLSLKGQMEVRPKGVPDAITLYDVGGIGGAYNLCLPETRQPLRSLPKEVPIKFQLVSGKTVGSETIETTICSVARKMMEILLPVAVKSCQPPDDSQHLHDLAPGESVQTRAAGSVMGLERLTNLKLTLVASDGADIPGDFYGKVLDFPRDGTALIVFTSMPPHVEAFFEALQSTC